MSDTEPEVPSLEKQEMFGGYHEEIEKLVDGVLEDIKGGHVTTRAVARKNVLAATALSRYSTDLNYAVIAIICGSAKLKAKALELGALAIEVRVRERLADAPGYENLPEDTPERLAEIEAHGNRV